MEDKMEIAFLLRDALKATAQYRDLHDLLYVEGDLAYPYNEAVIVSWNNGRTKKINVNMDSGSAIIRDVLLHIDEEPEDE